MVCNGFLMGVVSVGYSCGVVNFPGIYTKLSMYRKWITSTSGI